MKVIHNLPLLYVEANCTYKEKYIPSPIDLTVGEIWTGFAITYCEDGQQPLGFPLVIANYV